MKACLCQPIQDELGPVVLDDEAPQIVLIVHRERGLEPDHFGQCCFCLNLPAELTKESGKPVYCETSAVA